MNHDNFPFLSLKYKGRGVGARGVSGRRQYRMENRLCIYEYIYIGSIGTHTDDRRLTHFEGQKEKNLCSATH